MKSLVSLAAIAAISAVAAPAFAQTSFFAPVSYEGTVGYTSISQYGGTLGAVDLRAAANFGAYAAIEGEGAFGVSDANVTGGAKLRLNNEYAAYGVARWPVIANANLFARLGYGHSDVKATAGSLSASTGVDSVNYGVGGEYFLDGKNGVRVDYTRYDFQSTGSKDADTWSVGYVRKF